MNYTSQTQLSLDEEYILINQVLPKAKEWVMRFDPSSALHQQGLKTLRYWNVKDAELRQRMAALDAERKRHEKH